MGKWEPVNPAEIVRSVRTKPDIPIQTKPITPDVVEAWILRSSRRKAFDVNENGCHIWTGSKNARGYGKVYLNGKMYQPHRVAFAAAKGADIEPGLVIDHTCRTPNCVNPEHLEEVSNRVNVLRGTSDSASHSKKTHCPRGHKLSLDNLVDSGVTRGLRLCLTCSRDRDKTRGVAIKRAYTLLGITYSEYVALHGRSLNVALDIIEKGQVK